MSQPDLIFISYARRDGGEPARRLNSDLEKAGFDSWLDTTHIAAGAVCSPLWRVTRGQSCAYALTRRDDALCPDRAT
jgi:hypothetical protein